LSDIEITTEQEATELRDTIMYAAAVVANIRARLDKYHECYVDDSILLQIWGGKPWLEATGNLHQRIKKLAKEMQANVDWPNRKDEARFYRKVPLIVVAGPESIQ
jgi:hypothetical protein